MDTLKLYSPDFPKQRKVEDVDVDVDVVSLYHKRSFEELDAVIICRIGMEK